MDKMKDKGPGLLIAFGEEKISKDKDIDKDTDKELKDYAKLIFKSLKRNNFDDFHEALEMYLEYREMGSSNWDMDEDEDEDY